MYYYIRIGWVSISLGVALFQFVIAPHSTNLLCTALVVGVNILAGLYLLQERNFRCYAFSSLQVLMFILSNFTLPLILTTAEGHPLIYNLVVPVETFGWCSILAITLIIAHAMYKESGLLQKFRETLSKKINLRLGLFQMPSEVQFWLMGFAGCLVMAYVYLFLRDAGEVSGTITNDANVKFLQAFQGFAYAPYLLLLRFLFGETPKILPRNVLLLTLYSGVILLLSIGRNSRSTFSVPILIVVIGGAIGLLTFRLPASIIKLKIVIPLLLAGIITAPFLSNLSGAMLTARHYRGTVTSAELIQISIDALTNQDNNSNSNNYQNNDPTWDENYVQSPFFSRFIYVKFHDNVLNLTNGASESFREDLKSDVINRIVSLLPAPILEKMSITLDKSEALRGSPTDYIYYLRYGRGLGGFKTGSFIGPGNILLRWGFLPVMYLTAIFAFVIVDSLAILRRINQGGGTNEVVPWFAPVGMMGIYSTATFFIAPDLGSFVSFFVRGFPQIIVLYMILFYMTRFFNPYMTKVASYGT